MTPAALSDPSRLREIRDRLAAGEPLPEAEIAAAIAALDAAARAAERSASGAHHRRNAALAVLLQEAFSTGSARSCARAAHAALVRYAATAWRAGDRRKATCPHPAGSLPAMLWAVLRAIDSVPSVGTIRAVQSGQKISPATSHALADVECEGATNDFCR